MKKRKIKIWRRKRAQPKRGFGRWRVYITEAKVRSWAGYSLLVLARSRPEAEHLVYEALNDRIAWENLRESQSRLVELTTKPQVIMTKWEDW